MNTIDDYVSENGIVRVDFIKADIEGAERDMLRGVVKILQRFKPKLSICTYHLKDDPEVLESIVKNAVPEYKVHHAYKKMYVSV